MSEVSERISELDIEATIVESGDPFAALGIWQRALEMATAEVLKNPDPQWQYTCGYLQYMIWARTGSGFSETENSLRACLSEFPALRCFEWVIFKRKSSWVGWKDDTECAI